MNNKNTKRKTKIEKGKQFKVKINRQVKIQIKDKMYKKKGKLKSIIRNTKKEIKLMKEILRKDQIKSKMQKYDRIKSAETR